MDNLCNIPLFSSLDPEKGAQLAKECIWKEYDANELVIDIKLITLSDEINLDVMKVLTQRIRTLNMRLAEQSFLQAKHRIYAELLRLSKPRMGHEGQRSISPPPTQRELADRIGTRREVVSRELNSLHKQGIFEKTKGALVIKSTNELQKRISDAWEKSYSG